ncbi:MAG: lysophospholipid acyltransferase family protein [Terrimicrobiaceae bacterium]|jgi:lauroyl/myristoyl acyltransferase|nr:lysophospholipid acyltransferase family protein [Terrimicrobiaceae bacterium]
MVFPKKKAGQHEAAAGVTIRHRFEYLGLLVAGFLVQRLPRRCLVWLAIPLGSLAYRLDPRGRKVAMQNLDSVFGEDIDQRAKRGFAESGYRSFARTMLELFWSPNLTRETASKIFRTEGLAPEAAGVPTIYVTTHFSNFEWLGQNIRFFRGPGIIVAQRLKNPLLGRYFDRLRGSTGHTIIPQERAIARMLKHLKGGGYFCAVIDLNLDPNEASVIIDEFSGLKTCVTQMHAALALHTGARIVPAECRPQPDGTHRMIYHKPLEYPPEATPAEIAQQCWDVLEPGIRENPGCWLWSYKHWRFKPSEGDVERFPDYANTAKRFDTALRIDEAIPRTSAQPRSGHS